MKTIILFAILASVMLMTTSAHAFECKGILLAGGAREE
jgi:hypothetical protein